MTGSHVAQVSHKVTVQYEHDIDLLVFLPQPAKPDYRMHNSTRPGCHQGTLTIAFAFVFCK